MTPATTSVQIPIDDDRMAELQEREPEKTPAEIVENALELYRLTYEPWVTLDEHEARVGGDDA